MKAVARYCKIDWEIYAERHVAGLANIYQGGTCETMHVAYALSLVYIVFACRLKVSRQKIGIRSGFELSHMHVELVHTELGVHLD